MSKLPGIVLFAAVGVALAGRAHADCHDARKAGPARACRAAVEDYANAWKAGTGDTGQGTMMAAAEVPGGGVIETPARRAGESAFDRLFVESAQLTGTVEAINKDTVVQRLEELKRKFGGATYTIVGNRISGGHPRVGGFLFFGGTELENLAALQWTALVKPNNTQYPPFEERVTAYLLSTGVTAEKPWQFVTLFIRSKR